MITRPLHPLFTIAWVALSTSLLLSCTREAATPPAGIASAPLDAEAIEPLRVGDSLPRLIVRTLDGQPFDINAAVAAQPAVIVFYRGGWCPYCTVHLKDLQTIEAQVIERGYQILAISPDRPEKLLAGFEDGELAYHLLSDASMEAALAFGIAFKVDKATIERYREFDIDLEDASGQTHHLLPVPAVFVVATDGSIRFAHVDPDYRERLSTDDVLSALDGIRR